MRIRDLGPSLGNIMANFEVDFGRRSPAVCACMSLHNFCIDEDIEEAGGEIVEDGESRYSMAVQSDGRGERWERYPLFNEHGAPQQYLDTIE
mmetsp:Transcript_11799/g.29821  ORF Transcript_11799/g.29821 Transcript_11799/m.29821 type:complete len:92 (+) Transcript_11799:1041-1316(+)